MQTPPSILKTPHFFKSTLYLLKFYVGKNFELASWNTLSASKELDSYFALLHTNGESTYISVKILRIMKNLYIYSVIFTFILIVGYFFYTQYEARQSSSCTSCQTGNIIGTSLIAFTKLVLLSVSGYFLFNPF